MVELLVVVAVLGILAMLLLPTASSALRSAGMASRRARRARRAPARAHPICPDVRARPGRGAPRVVRRDVADVGQDTRRVRPRPRSDEDALRGALRRVQGQAHSRSRCGRGGAVRRLRGHRRAQGRAGAYPRGVYRRLWRAGGQGEVSRGSDLVGVALPVSGGTGASARLPGRGARRCHPHRHRRPHARQGHVNRQPGPAHSRLVLPNLPRSRPRMPFWTPSSSSFLSSSSTYPKVRSAVAAMPLLRGSSQQPRRVSGCICSSSKGSTFRNASRQMRSPSLRGKRPLIRWKFT
ncbi:hypothetical protein HQ560_02590 [bacterium]|nr:hypothetical protein [bacterium]